MEALLSIWNRIGVFGTGQLGTDQSRLRSRQLTALVYIGLVGFALYIPFMLIFGWHALWPTHAAGIGVLLLTLFLNQADQFGIARWFFSLGLIMVFLWNSLLLPAMVSANYFQLILAVLPLLLFKKPGHCIALFATALGAFMFSTWYHANTLPWTDFNDPLLGQLNRFTQFSVLFLILFHFKRSADSSISELRASKHQLEKRNKDLEVMTRAVSHDLKTPIRNISHLASWIEEDYGDDLADDTRDRLGHIQARSERMENLINDLLEYSKIGSNHRAHEAIPLNQELREMVRAYSGGTTLTLEVAGEIPLIRTSRIAIYQIFHNLLDNAIRHHHKDRGSVVLRYQRKDDEHWFQVIDDGPGIAEQFHSKIFDVFQTLEGNQEGSGTGIGLSIVKRNVEEIGGRIWVASEPGSGATFTVAIPASRV